jgi:hypothetical protein
MGFFNPFVSTSTRTFHTSDAPNRASDVVGRMTVQDGAPNGLPPGVLAARTGAGHFDAVSPFAAFDSSFQTQSDGRGGSYVTERETAFSPIPGAAYLAGMIHDAVTKPEGAYDSASSRDDD